MNLSPPGFLLGKICNVAITVQNLPAVFPNYSSLYLVFLCFLTLSRAIIVLGVWLWLGWVGFIYLFSGFGETQFAALNRQQWFFLQPFWSSCIMFVRTPVSFFFLVFFERSEFLIATSKKKKTDRLCVWMSGCSANLGFSVRSANRIRPKHGIPLPV